MITEEQFNQLLERITKIEETLQDLKAEHEAISDKLDDIESAIECIDIPSPEEYEEERIQIEEERHKEEELINTPVIVHGDQKDIPDNEYDYAKCAQLILEEGIEEIGWQGIARCDNLTELTIPSSVRKIGYLFCCECRKLEKVTFLGACPLGLERAFEGCRNLKAVYVPGKYADEYMKALKRDVVSVL